MYIWHCDRVVNFTACYTAAQAGQSCSDMTCTVRTKRASEMLPVWLTSHLQDATGHFQASTGHIEDAISMTTVHNWCKTDSTVAYPDICGATHLKWKCGRTANCEGGAGICNAHEMFRFTHSFIHSLLLSVHPSYRTLARQSRPSA